MQLISTFRRLDLQAASYEGSYHIKSITNEFIHYPELLPDTRRIAYLEFESFLEARSYLDCFVLSAFHFMRSTAEPLKYLQGDKLMELGYQSVASERERCAYREASQLVGVVSAPHIKPPDTTR
jgi:hypothetical protein